MMILARRREVGQYPQNQNEHKKRHKWMKWIWEIWGGEEEALIKWWDYEIEILIAICGEMEQEFANFARKQTMYLYITLIIVHLKNINWMKV